jgi:cell division septation protein DedD
VSEAGRRSSGQPGRLATAGGALLLVVVGFAIGLVVGAAFEEPDLVLDQLAGRGERVAVEEVELSPAGDTILQELPAVAAASAAMPAQPPAAGAGRQPPWGSGEGLRSGYAIQVGAFADEPAARRLASELSALGLRGYVAPHGQGDERRWRVRVGPWASQDEARRIASRLNAERQLPTWVLREEGR